ncbi:hypothetical protein ACVBEH_17685, partial [Roseateles sp. GG27B]
RPERGENGRRPRGERSDAPATAATAALPVQAALNPQETSGVQAYQPAPTTVDAPVPAKAQPQEAQDAGNAPSDANFDANSDATSDANNEEARARGRRRRRGGRDRDASAQPKVRKPMQRPSPATTQRSSLRDRSAEAADSVDGQARDGRRRGRDRVRRERRDDSTDTPASDWLPRPPCLLRRVRCRRCGFGWTRRSTRCCTGRQPVAAVVVAHLFLLLPVAVAEPMIMVTTKVAAPAEPAPVVVAVAAVVAAPVAEPAFVLSVDALRQWPSRVACSGSTRTQQDPRGSRSDGGRSPTGACTARARCRRRKTARW